MSTALSKSIFTPEMFKVVVMSLAIRVKTALVNLRSLSKKNGWQEDYRDTQK